jgi:hypothetical protein
MPVEGLLPDEILFLMGGILSVGMIYGVIHIIRNWDEDIRSFDSWSSHDTFSKWIRVSLILIVVITVVVQLGRGVWGIVTEWLQ